ncbi:MAG: C4-type zinc ribbon domain-containing protein [Dehalococcoidia bacterium]|nr:C4-type zinc ribbon domain-containing protein [Dehalococcoidia bacterium]
MAQSKHLYELQKSDLDIEMSQAALRQLVGKLGESQALIEARAGVEAEEASLEKVRAEHRSLEGEAEDLAARIKSESERLYGGKVKSPKELSSIEQEVKALNGKKREREDRLLELMEQSDQMQTAVKEKRERLRQVEEEWREEQQQFAAEKPDLEEGLESLEERRQVLAGAIGAEEMRLYDALRRSKGQAVVRIELGRCQGCRLTLSVAELQQARTGKIMQCHSCGRILYL